MIVYKTILADLKDMFSFHRTNYLDCVGVIKLYSLYVLNVVLSEKFNKIISTVEVVLILLKIN